jgi:hypothetical protein
MKVIIYCLKDPRNNEIRYIGRTRKTLKERLQGHVHGCGDRKSNAPRTQWLKELKYLNLKPIIKKLKVIEGWKESHYEERKTIETYKLNGYNLLNKIDLGPGPEKNEGRHLTLYDLEGVRIKRFINVHATASYIGISYKHLEVSLRRKAKAVKGFQISDFDYPNLGKYKKISKTEKKNKSIIFENIENNEILTFSSRVEARDFFKLPHSTFYRLFQNNKLLLNKYRFVSMPN